MTSARRLATALRSSPETSTDFPLAVVATTSPLTVTLAGAGVPALRNAAYAPVVGHVVLLAKRGSSIPVIICQVVA